MPIRLIRAYVKEKQIYTFFIYSISGITTVDLNGSQINDNMLSVKLFYIHHPV